jgi:hypothetical protein
MCAPPEIFDRYSARELRISSAVFVQAKGRGVVVPVLDPVADVGFEGLD